MRLVSTKSSDVIHPDQCSTTSYYAVQMIDTKAFIAREGFDRGPFELRALRKLSNGNKYSQYLGESLTGLIQKLIDLDYRVYEFTDLNEFLEWLKD